MPSFGCIELRFLRHQPLRQFGVDAPVAQLVGIGQSRAAHRRTKSPWIELIGLRVQARFDVAQALAISQLRDLPWRGTARASQGAHATITVVATLRATEVQGMNPSNEQTANLSAFIAVSREVSGISIAAISNRHHPKNTLQPAGHRRLPSESYY